MRNIKSTNSPRPAAVLSLAGCLSLLAGCATTTSQPLQPPGPESEAFFLTEIKPILEMNCLKCHNPEILPKHLDLSTKAAAFAVMPDGRRRLVPGRPEKSLLLEAVARSGAHRLAMPPVYLSLDPLQIESIRQWIAAGAAWPSGPAGNLKPVYNPENPYHPAEAIEDIRRL